MGVSIATHLNPNWFNYSQMTNGGKVGLAGVKSEYVGELKQAIQEQQAQRRKADIAESKQIANTPIQLTQEQLNYLRETYDPKNMSQEQYNAFISDLEKFGVLSDGDSTYVGAGGPGLQLMPIESGWGTCAWNSLGETLLDYRGDAAAWAKFRASFLTVNPETGKFYQGKQAALFGRIENVLNQIS